MQWPIESDEVQEKRSGTSPNEVMVHTLVSGTSNKEEISYIPIVMG
jgi:hypothetical protein